MRTGKSIINKFVPLKVIYHQHLPINTVDNESSISVQMLHSFFGLDFPEEDMLQSLK